MPSGRGSPSPARHPTELRDLALLQLFFADLESTAATLAIAEEQLAWHRRQLATYEADRRFEDRLDDGQGISRTMQHWRGVTLRMGLLYEQAAVEFWGEVAASVAPPEPASPGPTVEPGRRSRTAGASRQVGSVRPSPSAWPSPAGGSGSGCRTDRGCPCRCRRSGRWAPG